MLRALAIAMAVLLSNTTIAAAEIASWYGPGLEGNFMANGERLNSAEPIAAHRTYPFGTVLHVCYDGCEDVTVKDRGPYIYDRDLDVSQGTAERIGLAPVGVDNVDVTLVSLP